MKIPLEVSTLRALILWVKFGRRPITSLVLAGLTAITVNATAGQQAGAPSARPPVVLTRFAVSDSTHDNIAKPVLLADGRILALSLFTHGREQKMMGRYSRDDGDNWTEPQPLFSLPEHSGGFGYFDAFTDRDGEVHIFYLNDGNTGSVLPKTADEPPVRSGQVLDIWQVRSRAKATQWEKAKPIWSGRAGDILSVIQLRSGRILLPISYMTARSWSQRGSDFKAFTYVGSFSSSAIYSDDDGGTWQQSPDELVVPTPDLFAIGGVEPVVIELRDGRVWMLIRTQMGRFYESFSSDGGVHWTVPKPSNIVASESPAALVRVNDGRILMIWNEALRFPYAYGGRHVLHAALSADEGKTWIGHREIYRDPMRKDPPPPNGDWGTSYAFPASTPSGAVVFSTWVETGVPRSMFRLDPNWLDQDRQRSEFAQGIEDWSTFGTQGVELIAAPGNAATRVLAIRKARKSSPSGAVWNFPMGSTGHLHVRLMLRDHFGGDTIGLSDHYSVPFDDRDTFFNVFNLPIGADGRLLDARLTSNHWHDLDLSWDALRQQCVVTVDGQRAGVVGAQRQSSGIDYLRFHPISDEPDGGLLLQSVSAELPRASSVVHSVGQSRAE